MIRIEQDGDHPRTFGSDHVGVVVVADVESVLGLDAGAGEGVFEDGGFGFVGVDFSGGEDEVKVVGDAEGFEFFEAGAGAVGDETERVATGAEGGEGFVGVVGEAVGGVVFFGQAGVDRGGQGLGVFFRASVGEEVAVGVVVPEFWSQASVLGYVLGDVFAVGPVGMCPTEGGNAGVGGVGCAELNRKVEEGFVGGGVIVAEGAIEVEEEGVDGVGGGEEACVFLHNGKPVGWVSIPRMLGWMVCSG